MRTPARGPGRRAEPSTDIFSSAAALVASNDAPPLALLCVTAATVGSALFTLAVQRLKNRRATRIKHGARARHGDRWSASQSHEANPGFAERRTRIFASEEAMLKDGSEASTSPLSCEELWGTDDSASEGRHLQSSASLPEWLRGNGGNSDTAELLVEFRDFALPKAVAISREDDRDAVRRRRMEGLRRRAEAGISPRVSVESPSECTIEEVDEESLLLPSPVTHHRTSTATARGDPSDDPRKSLDRLFDDSAMKRGARVDEKQVATPSVRMRLANITNTVEVVKLADAR